MFPLPGIRYRCWRALSVKTKGIGQRDYKQEKLLRIWKKKSLIKYSNCSISWVRRIILCMFLQSRPLPPTGAHVRSPAPRIVHGVELHRGPLLEQLDCLACGRDGFIGYLREHSLLPCTLSNLLRDKPAL